MEMKPGVYRVHADSGKANDAIMAALVDAGIVKDGRVTEIGLAAVVEGMGRQLHVIGGLPDSGNVPGCIIAELAGIVFGVRGTSRVSLEKLTREDGAIMIRIVFEPIEAPPESEQH